MGWRKIVNGRGDFDDMGEKNVSVNPESIYLPQNWKDGYHINIQNEIVKYFLNQYMKEIGAGAFGISNMERFDFERRFMNWIASNDLQTDHEGRLLDVNMIGGKPTIDTAARDARIEQIKAERGSYTPRKTFDIPDFVKQEMAEKRRQGIENVKKHQWNKEPD